MTVTDYPDYQTPQAHADTISNTGVPLLARPGSLVNQSGTVASGATVTVASNIPVHKVGYEIALTWFAPATNQSIITMQLIWSDSVSGQVVVTDEWDFYAGSGPIANAHIIRGTGPTKGDTLTIKATQTLSTVTASYTIVMAENSRIYLRDDWRTDTSGPVTGITGSNGFDPQNNILASVNAVAVAASGSVTSVMPLFSGRISISGLTLSLTSDYTIIIHSPTASFGSVLFDQVVRVRSDANGNIPPVSAYLPRAQCTLQVFNGNAAAKDLDAFIVSADY